MKKHAFVYAFLFSFLSLQCQTVSNGFSHWWDDFRGKKQEEKKKNQHPEMKDTTDPNQKPYEKYEDEMDPYRVLRD
jgi:hypothetical protein